MTARDLSAGMQSAIADGHVRAALLVEGQFLDPVAGVQFVRLWTGVGPLLWNGATWTGAGQLLSVDGVGEAIDNQASGFSVKLSGMPLDKIAIALQSTQRNAPGRLRLALFDAGWNLVADPYLVRQGRFSAMPIDDDGGTATITVQYDDLLAALQQSRERRYTSQSQALRDPADLGFALVEAIQAVSFNFAPPAAQ